jgi:hypothetical protein
MLSGARLGVAAARSARDALVHGSVLGSYLNGAGSSVKQVRVSLCVFAPVCVRESIFQTEQACNGTIIFCNGTVSYTDSVQI